MACVGKGFSPLPPSQSSVRRDLVVSLVRLETMTRLVSLPLFQIKQVERDSPRNLKRQAPSWKNLSPP